MKRVRLAGEEGYLVATSIIVLGIMLTLGLGSYAFVDGNTKRSKVQRDRESSLTLAEGALYAQSFALARSWPSAATNAYPTFCTSGTVYTAGTAPAKQCPDRNTLAAGTSSTPAAAAFRSVDFGAVAGNAAWTTRVRDNGGALATAYQPTLADQAQGACAGPCAYDFNGDNAVWVQSESVIHSRKRSVVALMQLEKLAENVPQTAVTAGALKITNNGNNLKINAAGSSVTLRCNVSLSTCAEYEADKGQIQPVAPVQGSPPPLLNSSQLQRFRETAQALGTYHEGCPTDIYTAPIIFVEECGGDSGAGGNYDGKDNTFTAAQGYTANCAPPAGLDGSCINSIQKPGLLIVHCGAMRMTGNWTYVGVMYFANNSDGTCSASTPARGTSPATCTGNSIDGTTVVDTQGGFGVWGAMSADGNACVKLGSNGGQVMYDRNVFNAFVSFGTVGVVQNTWRELQAND
jgi:Tfp pilus assembly protein PilX